MAKGISKMMMIWVVFLLAITNFGSFYIWDIPQELAAQLFIKFNITQTELNLCYAICYLPNIFILFFSSKIINKLGSGMTVLISAYFVFLGSIGLNCGVQFENFRIFILGRFVFGAGGMICLVAMNCMVEEWFKGANLSFATSFTGMMNLLAVAASNYVSVLSVYEARSLNNPIYIGTAACLVSLVFSLILYFIDKAKKQKDSGILSKLSPHKMIQNHSETGDSNIPFYNSIASEDTMSQDQREDESPDEGSFKTSCQDLNNARYFYVGTILAFTETAYFQFTGLAFEILMIKLGFTQLEAKDAMTYFVLETVVTMPFYGWIIGKYGKKVHFLIFSCILALIGFGMMVFLPLEKSDLTHFALLLLSQFFSILSAVIWPAVMICVPSRSVGIALGICTVWESILMAGLPFLTGALLIKRVPSEFYYVLYILISLIGVSFLCSVLLLGYDYKHEKLLTLRESDPRVEEIRKRMELRTEEEKDQYFKRSVEGLGMSAE